MNSKRFLTVPLSNLLFAIFLIAVSVVFNCARAQNTSINVLGSSASNQTAKGPVVTTDQVRAELLAWAPDGVGPGKQVWLGLQLAHQPEWHTYWKNSEIGRAHV